MARSATPFDKDTEDVQKEQRSAAKILLGFAIFIVAVLLALLAMMIFGPFPTAVSTFLSLVSTFVVAVVFLACTGATGRRPADLRNLSAGAVGRY
ncbi:hypothetical protein ACFVH6_38100 [Spirillospora sp. NPDC127200]